ncbi:NAD-dependent epimerase/dehydratase family protein [Patulibacter sp. SYSU D01012]|uniref:NAD-dependent epimerase/dehydratase family protein n=1 Tax=Patulibacter sp. SYSU D01012 TaxID=2817381 RepID=UPI001B30D868
MSGARILLTAGAGRLGALVVRALEARDDVATVVAVDERPPGVPFARAEFVRLGRDAAGLGRVVAGTAPDVVVDLRAAAALAPLDPAALSAHAPTTRALADAIAAPESPVRRVVAVGSLHRYGWDARLPAFLREDTPVPPPRSAGLAAPLAAVEDALATAAAARPGVGLALLRLADPVGPAGAGVLAAADRLPLLPTILGFDPPLQVVGEDDAARAVAHVAGGGLDGTFLVAADGTLALSEALAALGRAHAPVLPPWGAGLLAGLLARAGLPAAPELAGQLLRGRGVDARRLKATGFAYRATTREALTTAATARRDRRRLGSATAAGGLGTGEPYVAEVEAFLRSSPAARAAPAPAVTPAEPDVGALPEDALLPLLPSLEPAALTALRAHEAAGPGRPRVLAAIDGLLRRG